MAAGAARRVGAAEGADVARAAGDRVGAAEGVPVGGAAGAGAAVAGAAVAGAAVAVAAVVVAAVGADVPTSSDAHADVSSTPSLSVTDSTTR